MHIFISFSVIFVLPSLVNKALCVIREVKFYRWEDGRSVRDERQHGSMNCNMKTSSISAGSAAVRARQRLLTKRFSGNTECIRFGLLPSMIAASVSLSVSGFAVQKRLNGFRSCLGWGLLGLKQPCIRREFRSPRSMEREKISPIVDNNNNNNKQICIAP